METKSKADLLKLDKATLTTLVLTDYDVKIDPEDMEKKEIVGYYLALQDGAQEVQSSDQEVVALSKALSPATPEDVKATPDPNEGADNKVKIVIHASPGIDGNGPVKVGVNGYVRIIKREAEVVVPWYVYDVLRKAEQTLFETITEGGGLRQVETKSMRFPVSFLGNVS